MKKYFLILGAVLLLTACGTSAEPDYYSLAMQPGAVTSDTTVALKIATPVLAGYLDRPDFVSQNGAYEIDIDPAHNWAEPIDKMFMRILASDLEQRLPASTIVTADDDLSSNTIFTADISLQRFNLVEEGAVILDGELLLYNKKSHTALTPIPLHLRLESGSSPEAVAEGLSTLVAQTADQIASRLAVLSKSVPASVAP